MPEMSLPPKTSHLARVIEKITSGRWLLANFAGASFLWMVVTQQIDPSISMAFVMLVANWYFQRPQERKKNESDS